MSLPSINTSRLQRAIADIEFDDPTPSATVKDLAEKVAASTWNMGLQLEPVIIARLIVSHRPKSQTPITDDDLITFADKDEDPPAAKAVPVVAAPTKVVATYDEAGRGRKGCPSCKKFVGNKTAICACGHDFKNAVASAPEEVAAEPVVKPQVTQQRPVELDLDYSTGGNQRVNVIYCPAGASPANLNSTELEEVKNWIHKVFHHFANNNQRLAMFGYCYLAREFYPPHTPEYKVVKRNIEQLFAAA